MANRQSGQNSEQGEVRMSRLSIAIGTALWAALSLSIPVFAADAVCQVLFDAMSKKFTVPSHGYMTEAAPGGKSKTSEIIYANGAIYLNLDGKWMRSKMSQQDMLKQEQENIRDSKTACRYLRDESVNGEAAALYEMHSENDTVKSDGQIWISKSKGLPLRVEADIDTGGGDKQHMSTRYDYSNVRAPAGVQ
jgi:hypothetical protein